MTSTQDILARLGISALSDMQTLAGALIDHNRNVVILAPTGSGKTLAYLLPLLRQIHTHSNTLLALILAPPRELAMQIGDVIKRMNTPVRHLCVYGGRPAMDEHRSMRSLMPHLIIGTPGRLLDHIRKQNFSTSGIKAVVVDEFDKMFELKFEAEVEQLFGFLSGEEHCILASATNMEVIPAFVGFRRAAPAILNWLDTPRPTAATGISHFLVHSPLKDKLLTLDALLRTCLEAGHQAIVFANHRESTERIAAWLTQQGHSVIAFHGGLDQKDRERALALFTNGSVCVLVSTDLAARGLDVPTLENVVHYHLPLTPEDYIHRCGRTGRWEREGRSFVILGPEEKAPAVGGITFEEYPLPPHQSKPIKPAFATLYIGRGKKDGLSKGDIVGFLCKKGNASIRDIGNISVQPHCAYVAVRRAIATQIQRAVAGEKIKKMSTIVEPVKSPRHR